MCLCALLAVASARAQVVDKTPRTDTLSVADRLSLRTNAADWLLLLPNIGMEFDLGNKNWSRWALGLDLRGNWQTSHTFKPGVVYNLAEARAELRYYWRPRQVDNYGAKKQTRFLDRLFSCRRDRVKHPTVAFYRGLYVAYSDYSFKFGSEGKQGSAVTLGVSWGAVRPLFVFANGHSLDFELGLNVGLCYANYDTFRHDREDDCYPVTGHEDWHIVPFPVLTDVRVGFVYRLGRYPSTSKYRWRYDCDYTFAQLQDSINSAREAAKINKQTADSLRGDMEKEFWRVYNAVADSNKVVADSLQRVAGRMRKVARREERERRDSLKTAEAAARKAEREAGNDSTAMPEDSVMQTLSDSLTARKDSAAYGDDSAKAVTAPVAAPADTATVAEGTTAESEPQAAPGAGRPGEPAAGKPSEGQGDTGAPASEKEEVENGEAAPSPEGEREKPEQAEATAAEENDEKEGETAPATSETEGKEDGNEA